MNGIGAYEIPLLRFAGIASSEVELHRFLKVNADGSFGYATAGTDIVTGVSGDHVSGGNPLDILTGIVIVEASAAITTGAKVIATVDGKAVTATTEAGAGVCLTGASAAGQYITVKLF